MRFSKLLEPLQALRDPTQLGVKTVHRIPQTPGSLDITLSSRRSGVAL